MHIIFKFNTFQIAISRIGSGKKLCGKYKSRGLFILVRTDLRRRGHRDFHLFLLGEILKIPFQRLIADARLCAEHFQKVFLFAFALRRAHHLQRLRKKSALVLRALQIVLSLEGMYLIVDEGHGRVQTGLIGVRALLGHVVGIEPLGHGNDAHVEIFVL